MKKTYENILLIDDDRFTNFYNTKVLSNHKSFGTINSVTSGKAALIYLKNTIENANTQKPDIIFLDINMPAMNGWEFLSEYIKLDKSLTNTINLIILTSSSYNDDYEKAKKIGLVNTILQKPLSKTALDNLINTLTPSKL